MLRKPTFKLLFCSDESTKIIILYKANKAAAIKKRGFEIKNKIGVMITPSVKIIGKK